VKKVADILRRIITVILLHYARFILTKPNILSRTSKVKNLWKTFILKTLGAGGNKNGRDEPCPSPN